MDFLLSLTHELLQIAGAYSRAASLCGGTLDGVPLHQFVDYAMPGPLQAVEQELLHLVTWMRGVSLGAGMPLSELLTLAAAPKVSSDELKDALEHARGVARLESPAEIAQYLERTGDDLVNKDGGCEGAIETSCAGCDDSLCIHRNGVLHDYFFAESMLFEWMPVLDETGRQGPLCRGCAIEAFQIRSAGFSRLDLKLFRKALVQANEARRMSNDDFIAGFVLPFYGAALARRANRQWRKQRDALKPKSLPTPSLPAQCSSGEGNAQGVPQVTTTVPSTGCL